MKNATSHLIIIFLIVISSVGKIFAQVPINDNCSGAIEMSEFLGAGAGTTTNAGTYNNNNATTNNNDPDIQDACFFEAVPYQRTLWYTFQGDGNTYYFEANTSCNDITDPIEFSDTQIALFTGECGNFTFIACNEDAASAAANYYPAGLSLKTVVGTTYFMIIDGNSTANGQFCLLITQCAINPGNVLATAPTAICENDNLSTLTFAMNGLQTNDINFAWVVETDFFSNLYPANPDTTADFTEFTGLSITPGNYKVYGILFDGQTVYSSSCVAVTPNAYNITVMDNNEIECGGQNLSCSAGNILPDLVELEQILCPGNDFTLLNNSNQVIPNNGSYGWMFIESTGNTAYNRTIELPGDGNFVGNLNELFAATGKTPLAPFTYNVVGYVLDSTGNICSQTPDSLIITMLPEYNNQCTGNCPYVTATAGSCVNNTYDVNIHVLSLGNFNSIKIKDAQGNDITVSATGNYNLGNYPSGSPANIFVETGLASCDTMVTVLSKCLSPCNIVAGGDFEGSLSSGWKETSSPVQPYYIVTNVTPYQGNFSAWLGGSGGAVTWSIDKNITFPVGGAAKLTFYMLPIYCANPQAYLKVFIDTEMVYEFYGNNSDCGAASFIQRNIDLPPNYCDGAAHKIKFELYEGGDNNLNTQVFIDNVQIEACGTPCTANAGSLQIPNQTVYCQSNFSSFNANATGYTNTPGYIYVYLLTDGAPTFNIKATSTSGQFNTSNLTVGSTYTVHGLSLKGNLNDIAGYTLANQIQAAIGNQQLCGDLIMSPNKTYNITYAEPCVGMDSPIYPNFEILNIAPVPANNFVQVSFNAPTINTTLTIFDVTGKQISKKNILTKIGSNVLKINTASYLSGLYFITFTNDKNTLTAKFLKQ